jgi:hypothetical protein
MVRRYRCSDFVGIFMSNQCSAANQRRHFGWSSNYKTSDFVNNQTSSEKQRYWSHVAE